MIPRKKYLTLALILALLFPAVIALADPPLENAHVPDHVIIKFKANASQHDKDLILRDLGATHLKHFKRIKSDLEKISNISVEDAIGRYKSNSKIEFIEPDYELHALDVPNDPMFDQLWGLQNTGQTGGTPGADISAVNAWDVFTGSENVIIGSIDTGVDYLHPDLAANIWVNPGEIPGNNIDDDGNGYIDDIHGWDFYNDDNDPMDDNGHGTHTSGTIGAVGNNGIGVTGINHTVRIMALKFLSASGSGSTADAIDCIEYATMMGVRLTSNSWGGGGYSEALRQSIADAGAAGILFVAAAGNSSSNTDVSPQYPSAYDLDNIVAVAATDHNDELASFSSYGPTTVDLAAPGVDILSTFPGNSYGTASGTSMATPHVSGVLGLVFGRFPDISALDAKALVLNSVDPVASLEGVVLTGGRLNAFWPIAEPDSIPPDPVTDLVVAQAGSNWGDLEWTATGDDGSTGQASRYEMRFSTVPIDDLNWESATPAAGAPHPGAPGTPAQMRVDGLDFNTQYYFAVKVLDEFGNASSLSNLASGTTLGAPDIDATPTSLAEALVTGGTSSQSITVRNVGEGTLDFEVPQPALIGIPPTIHSWTEVSKLLPDTRTGEEVVSDSGGPDGYGYRWVDSNDAFGPSFDWTDISGIGSIAMTSGDDESVGPIDLGFDFPYYDGSFSQFYVCSNGYISLSSSQASYSNQPLPTPGAPPHLIAPFWDDLTVASGTVYYYYDGSRLIVQWDGVLHYSSGGPYTFQAILYPDGSFRFQYLDMGQPDSEATIGWQNGIGTDGLDVAFNTAYVANGLAVEVRAVPQWVTVSPDRGTIWAPGSAVLNVDFDATGLLGGDYDGIIRILSNDPDETEYQIPVVLSVTGAPDIAAEPTSHDFGDLFLGASATTEVVVQNIGTDALTVSGITVGNPAFSVMNESFILQPRESRTVTVSFVPTIAQFYATTLDIASDDPVDPVISVDLTGRGLEPPAFSVNPASLSSSLFTGGTEAQSLDLSNTGGSDFDYNLSIDFHADVTVHESAVLGKDEMDPRQGILGSGGPDVYGYRWIDSDEPGGPAFNWVEISGTGTPVTTVTGDDHNWGPFPIGFTFPFYGNDFTEFQVCSNGWVSFTSTSTDYSNDPLPASGAPENLLAPFWDDLKVDVNAGANVFYEDDGSRLVIQYNAVPRYSSGGPYTFEILLYPNGTIVYQYLSMEGNLASATIGIQNDLKDDGLMVVYNDDYVHDGLAVRLAAFPEWLTLSPTAGTIPPDGSETVGALFDASGLFGGTYQADIIIESNDPAVPTLPVPVTLEVTGAPEIEVSETTIDFGSNFIGYPTLRSLAIANVGTDDLVITSASIDNADFLTNLSPPVTLGPTQQLLIDLNFLPSSEGTIGGTLTIGSNDVNHPLVEVALAGVGLVPPLASADPTSLSSALFTGMSEIQTVMLTNSGGSDLEFTTVPELTLEEVVVYDSPDLGKDETDPRQGILGSGGPDNFGYRWIDSDEAGGPVFDWVEISGTGAPVTTVTGDDHNWGPFPIGFTFPLYGNDFTEFRVCSNGWVSFTSSSTDLSNDPLPASGAPENLLAPFWDDLKVDVSVGANVFYENDGSRLVIQYNAVPRYSSGGPYTFEILIYPNGTIVYQYLSMLGTRLDEATIGIQNDLKDDGLTVAYNTDYVHDGLAVRLGTTPEWLSTNPTSGTVPAGESLPILVTFDATGLFGGAYDGALQIHSNDPMHGLITIPAHLDVTGIPLIAVDPEAMDFGTIFLSQSATLPLVVSNPGTQTLIVSGITLDDPDFSADLTTFEVEPLETQTVQVSFTPLTAGTYNATMSIAHNADGSPTTVDLTGIALVPPQVAWSPDTVVGAAMPGGQKVKTLQICNEGGSDLIFDLGTAEASGVSVTQYTGIEELPKEAEDTRPGVLGSGGPDAFGYTWVDSDDPDGPVYDWVDVSSVGTVIFGSYSDDGNRGPQPIGFDFPFYGQNFEEFNVCSNGWMSFTSTSTRYTNEALPNSYAPENLLAPFWDDMVVDPSRGLDVYYYNDGSRLIVQYHIRRIAAYDPPYYEFEVLLYPDGRIVYQYQSLGSRIDSATIGIQNATKDDGLTVVYNDTYVHDNLAIQFSAVPAWLSVSPETGVVPPGECVEVQVTMDASSLGDGDYDGTVAIASNDPDEPMVNVPVIFHVGTILAADSSVEPNTLNLDSNGKWMSARVELPPEFNPADIVIETVRFNGVVPAATSPFSYSEDFNGNGIPDLLFKFDRSLIEDILPEGEDVVVTVTGEIRDTTYFVATNTIRVINPHMVTPNGGEVWQTGATQSISWTIPQGWHVDHADVFFTIDGGENWYDVARGVEGNSCQWNLPVTLTSEARVRVFIFDNQGLLGFDSSDGFFETRSIVTGVELPVVPKEHALLQNVPNPFNPRTIIAFDLPKNEQVNITVYDVRGSVVKTLMSEWKSAGRHQVVWDGMDKGGHQVASGVYYYRIAAGEYLATKRMLLLK